MIDWIRASIFISLFGVCSPSIAQIVSIPLNSGNADPAGEGFIYALPLNTIKVNVHVVKTEKCRVLRDKDSGNLFTGYSATVV